MYVITSKTIKGELITVLGTHQKREKARQMAADLGGTVRTDAEVDKLYAEGKLNTKGLTRIYTPAGYEAPKRASLVDIAADIAKSTTSRKTIGKKVKAPKRVATPEDVLEAAVKFVDEQNAAAANKVQTVRALAAWKHSTGVQLQRRDMFTVLRRHACGANIADATISTQFQIVRAADKKTS